ncbi:MAG: 6-pyruvoyl tetrahydropterin synthase [Bacteroidetes bacterium ADurb.Bin408]|nr:MAG: 6-pyruvoyl tetrahydropterin synthase [Bacteroidetes bacterium ADurb.Bin408]
MSRIRITKRFTFEMAHALSGYDGLCRNIHGHSYILWVTIAGEPVSDKKSPKDGMLLDYSDLSSIIKDKIISGLDHCLLLKRDMADATDTFRKDLCSRLVYVDYQPTCENLLADLAKRIRLLLPSTVNLHSLKLQETENSYAEWFSEDNK